MTATKKDVDVARQAVDNLSRVISESKRIAHDNRQAARRAIMRLRKFINAVKVEKPREDGGALTHVDVWGGSSWLGRGR